MCLILLFVLSLKKEEEKKVNDIDKKEVKKVSIFPIICVRLKMYVRV